MEVQSQVANGGRAGLAGGSVFVLATLIKTRLGKWKAVIRKTGWPMASKTFRVKRDAEDWARNTEDDMVRGVFINRVDSHQLSLSVALERYLSEITPTKRPTTAEREKRRAKTLKRAAR